MVRMSCPVCGGKMKGHGTTAAGSKRWQCMSCGATATRKIDSAAKGLEAFLGWLFSPTPQASMPGGGRTFRRKAERYWRIWPVAPACDEVHHVVHVDGIWLGRACVMLTACTADHVVGWHLARSECSASWGALMSRIAPPDAVVCDGGAGFEKARREHWPQTKVQRCTFHAFCQVKRCTTTRPNLQAGVELYALAKDMLKVDDADGAARWLASFARWCSEWEAFLGEKAVVDGRTQFKHQRLRKARRGLEQLCRSGRLFTFLDPELAEGGTVPSTNNRIEGMNSRLRELLRGHRGMPIDHRVKAMAWWLYMRTESPMPAARIMAEMPTDESIANMCAKADGMRRNDEAVQGWGAAVAWEEFHAREWRGPDW